MSLGLQTADKSDSLYNYTLCNCVVACVLQEYALQWHLTEYIQNTCVRNTNNLASVLVLHCGLVQTFSPALFLVTLFSRN